MKKRLLITALMAAAATLVTSSCTDDAQKPDQAGKQNTETAAPKVPEAPTNEEISRAATELLGTCGYATPGALSYDLVPAENGKATPGKQVISTTLKMVVKENLYSKANAPEEFNKERQAVNEAANLAIRPDSAYLVQVGAPTDLITDEDRKAKELPQELQAALLELRELAEQPVYKKVADAGQEVEVAATFEATWENGAWSFRAMNQNTAALLELADYTAESALPEGAPVLTPEFTSTRKAEITEKVAAFNAQAAPFNQGREEAARQKLTELMARADEEAKRTQEQVDAQQAEQQQWQETCTKMLADGNNFAGEWTRGKHFGEITLHIEQAKVFDTSIQFVGSIYDTKLPEASLDIAGRCELMRGEGGSEVNITIYDGQYDPDQPTAEVYDAKDGMLILHLDNDGKLSGVMTCESWGEAPEKAFSVQLTPKAAQKPAKDTKKR